LSAYPKEINELPLILVFEVYAKVFELVGSNWCSASLTAHGTQKPVLSRYQLSVQTSGWPARDQVHGAAEPFLSN
jgi:hypothetical protein